MMTALTLGGAMLLAAAPATAQEFVLKYGHVGPATEVSDDHIPGVWLKSFLESRSQGRIKVEIYPASQLGGFRELVEQIQLGTLELAHTSVGGINAFVPEIQVTDLPYLLRDDRVAEAINRTSFFPFLRDAVLEKTGNIRLVTIANTGRWRSFFTTTRPVQSVQDLQALKIRVVDSPIQLEFMRALGANPVAIPWGEVYTSLATGVAEGMNIAATDIVPNRMHDYLKHLMLDDHLYLYGFYWISDSWLMGLPEELRTLVIDGVVQMGEIQANWNKQYESRSLEEFAAGGGTIHVPTAEQKAELTARAARLKDWFAERYDRAWLDAWLTAIAEAEAMVEADRAFVLGTN
jgi:TRAP-type C4-dicarboxylate transport system substrate-binding protein